MAIFKAVVHSEYATIPNATLQDTALSFEARGVLAMLLSMPDTWEVHKSWIVTQSKAGKDKINSIFAELETEGYIRKSEGQRKYGRFTSDDYFVFPTKNTVADLPTRSTRSGLAVDGESASIKETSLESKHRDIKHNDLYKKLDFVRKNTSGSVMDEVPDNVLSSWVEIAGKLTPGSLRGTILELEACEWAGVNPTKALSFVTGKRWKGFQAKWVIEAMPNNMATADASLERLMDTTWADGL